MGRQRPHRTGAGPISGVCSGQDSWVQRRGQVVGPALDLACPANQPTSQPSCSGRERRGARSLGRHQADTAVFEWVAIELSKHASAITEQGFGFRTESFSQKVVWGCSLRLETRPPPPATPPRLSGEGSSRPYSRRCGRHGSCGGENEAEVDWSGWQTAPCSHSMCLPPERHKR